MKLSYFKNLNFNEQFVPMLVHGMKMVLKCSPGLLLIGDQNFRQSRGNTFYILALVEGSLSFCLAMILIITILLIGLMTKLLLRKKLFLAFEWVPNILFPFQIYFSLVYFYEDHLNKFLTGMVCLCLMQFFMQKRISLSIMIIKNFVIDVRNEDSDHLSAKCVSKMYLFLSDLIMVMLACGSFFIGISGFKLPFLCFLVLLCLAKTMVLLTRINYESPLIQYTAYACQIMSYLTIVEIFTFFYFDIYINILLWMFLLLIVAFIMVENPLISKALEIKYTRFLKEELLKCIFFNNKLNYKNQISIQDSLIVYLSLAKYVLVHYFGNDEKKPFIRFSDQFLHQICSIVTKVDQQSRLSQSERCFSSLSQFSKTFDKMGSDIVKFINTKVTSCGQSQHQQQYWQIIKSLNQLTNFNGRNLNRFILYSLPRTLPKHNFLAIYLYYKSYQVEDLSVFQEKQCPKESYLTQLHKKIDYNFVINKIMRLKKAHEVLKKQKIEYQHEQGNSRQKQIEQDSPCITEEIPFLSTTYDQFYQTTICQQHLSSCFKTFATLQTQTIQILSSQPNVHKLMRLLARRRSTRKQIISLISSPHQITSSKYILFQYILYKYILKLPYLAKHQLNLLEDLKEQNVEKNKNLTLHFGQKDQGDNLWLPASNSTLNALFSSRVICLVSGSRNPGCIVYGCNQFKALTEIKSPLTLTSMDKNESLNIHNLILPCFVESHDQAMTQWTSFQSPHKHNKHACYIKSLLSKQLYQVDFDMHFIYCNLDDLVIALDITYRRVEYLAIFREGQKVYCSQTMKKANDKPKDYCMRVQDNHVMGFCATKEVYQELVFGVSHKIVVHYQPQIQQELIQTMTLMSYLQEQRQILSSVNVFEFNRHQERVTAQRKLERYREKNFLFSSIFYMMVLTIVIFTLAMIIVLSQFSAFTTTNQVHHQHLYRLHTMVQNDFFLTDLKSYSSILTILTAKFARITFSTLDQAVNFYARWNELFLLEMPYLQERVSTISRNLAAGVYGMNTLFTPLNTFETSSLNTTDFFQLFADKGSFFLLEKKFDIQYSQLLRNLLQVDIFTSDNQTEQSLSQSPVEQTLQASINFEDYLNMQNIGSFIYSSVQKINFKSMRFHSLSDFYTENVYIYNSYVASNGILAMVENLAAGLVTEETFVLNVVFYFAVVSIMIGVGFVAVKFIKVKIEMYQFLQHAFSFPDLVLSKMRMSIQKLKDLVEESSLSSFENTFRTINTSHSVTQNRHRTNFIRFSATNKKKEEKAQYHPIRKNLWELIFLLIFTIALSLLLAGGLNSVQKDIDEFNRYFTGTKQLIDIGTKCGFLFNQVIDGLISTKRALNPAIPSVIDALKQTDKIKILKKLQTDQKKVEQYLFHPWNLDSGTTQMFQAEDSEVTNSSLMESVSKQLKLYQQTYNNVKQIQNFTLPGSRVLQMYNHLSYSVQIIRQLLRQAKQNYHQLIEKNEKDIYFSWCQALVAIFCTVWIIFLFFIVRKEMVTVVEEVLAITIIKNMKTVPMLDFYLNKASQLSPEKNLTSF